MSPLIICHRGIFPTRLILKLPRKNKNNIEIQKENKEGKIESKNARKKHIRKIYESNEEQRKSYEI
jgi:hypothetical protein